MTYGFVAEDGGDAKVVCADRIILFVPRVHDDLIGGILKGGVDRQRGNLFIRAEDVLHRQWVGQWFHPVGVELVELIDVIENRGELLLHSDEIGLGQFEPRQPRHFAYLIDGK